MIKNTIAGIKNISQNEDKISDIVQIYRMKFKDDESFTFNWKNLNAEMKEKPIWECIKKYIIPALDVHLPFTDINDKFDIDLLDY